MRFSDHVHDVEARGIGDTHTAQIAATPAMFRIFYDQIYTQKEYAIVRELLCNAWDAHKMADTTDRPIEIHMPTVLEPWFQITDYGTGLSYDAVFELYMNYGNSDKRTTNELIGGYGLGSKAPFCLTDQFTVISRQNGQSMTFQAYIQQDGAPGCSHINTVDTDDDNGLTVYVPLNSDFSTEARFRRALVALVPNLPTLPKLNVDISEENGPPINTYQLDGPFTYINSATITTHRHMVPGPFQLVMGIVPYEFRLGNGLVLSDELRQKLYDRGGDNLVGFAREWLREHNTQFTFYSDVGQFNHTVSREQLSEDQQTRERIQHTAFEVITAFYDQLRERLDNASTFHELVTTAQILKIDPQIGHSHPWASYLLNDNIRLPDWHNIFQSYDLSFRKQIRFSMDLKSRTREAKGLSASIDSFDKAVIAVAPTTAYSIKNFGEDWYKNQQRDESVICLLGDVNNARRMVDDLGLKNEVIAMPRIKRTASSSKAGLKGATRYDQATIDVSQGQFVNTDSVTAEDFANQLDQVNDPSTTIIVLNQRRSRFLSLFRPLRADVLRFNDPTIQTIEVFNVSEHHRKVQRNLQQYATSLGFHVVDSMADFYPFLNTDMERLNRYYIMYEFSKRQHHLLYSPDDDAPYMLLYEQLIEYNHPIEFESNLFNELQHYSQRCQLHEVVECHRSRRSGSALSVQRRNRRENAAAIYVDYRDFLRDQHQTPTVNRNDLYTRLSKRIRAVQNILDRADHLVPGTEDALLNTHNNFFNPSAAQEIVIRYMKALDAALATLEEE